MKKLTQKEFETIYLYGYGLTFDEVSKCLKINSRGIYNNAKRKDRQRVMRAKIKRDKNIAQYKIKLKEKIQQTKEHNTSFERYSKWVWEYNYIAPETAKRNFRILYIQNCLKVSFRKYQTYKRKLLQKVA